MTKTKMSLDDKNLLAATDRAEMLGETVDFAEQCREAVDAARKVSLTINAAAIENIVVLGMGGSGISGDVSRVLFENQLSSPLTVNRHYHLPAFVGPKTLVIAVSYSGNTEETLAALAEALERRARCIAVSSGGRLREVASDQSLDFIEIPAGHQPRASLGYLSLPVAVILEELGLVADLRPAIAETLAMLEAEAVRFGPDSPESVNPAKQLARRLHGKMPVVYGSEGLTALAAFRLKCQINENAKTPAQWNYLPELDHNEITGWQLLADLTQTNFHLIFLRDQGEHGQVKKRVEVTRDLIQAHFCAVEEFWSQGESFLTRLFSLIYLGDFTSIYLALLSGVDPSPVERIELLKKRLA